MTDPPKLVQRTIPIDRLMQEYGRVCLQLKFTEGELENARTAIESLQKALAAIQENQNGQETIDPQRAAPVQSVS